MVKKAENEEVVAAQPVRAPAKERSSTQAGGILRYIAVMAVAAVMAVGAGVAAINTYVIEAGAREQSEKLATIYARQYAAFYNQIFSQASRQIAGVTSDSSLADIMASGDPAAIQQRTRLITSSMVSKAEVSLIPANSTLNQPGSYAAQEMVTHALQGEPITAEIIPTPQHPQLLLAARIHDAAGTTVGAMLVSFDLLDIADKLKTLDAGAGYMTLRQQIDKSAEPQVVMSHGSESQGGFEAVVPTTNPNLTISFVLEPGSASQSKSGLFLLMSLVMALAAMGAIFVTSLLLRNVLRRNASMLLEYAETLVRRAPPPVGINFSIDMFEEVANSLKRSARNGSGTDTGTVPQVLGTASERIATAKRQAAATADDDHDNAPRTAASTNSVPDEIFRAYDIRGVVGKTLTEDTVRLIGKAIGSENLAQRQNAIHVGRDGRLSGPQLLKALIEGITSTGCNVIDIGMVPTPLVYFAAAHSAVKSGVMLTGSHNPPDYNGLKIVINGETLSDERIQALKQRIQKNDFLVGNGSVDKLDIGSKYNNRIKDDIVLARSLKIVVDCGNGVAGAVAPALLEGLGCSVVPLYCDVDGNFPNHHPDPSKADNLKDLIARVASEGADLGLAFDGDGDRIGVVTPKGDIIWPDRLMMLYSRDLLMRTPGADIIYDVKCTRDLATVISQNGGRPIMWRTGHSLIKAKLKETGAALAGEMSGHIFFNDRWPGFDDGIYAAARLLEILSLEVASADEVFAEFPINVSTPELHIDVTEDSKFRIVDALQKNAQFPGGSVSTIDGVRVDYPNAWGLVRASNTTPVLVARFEGRTQQDLDTVRDAFREQLLKVEPSLRVSF